MVVFKSDIALYASIGYIQIVSLCRILGSQCINLLHHRKDAVVLTQIAHYERCFLHWFQFVLKANGTCHLEIGETIYLCFTQQIAVKRIDVAAFHCLINLDNMLQFFEEPLINLGQLMNIVNGVALMHSLWYHKDTLISRLAQSSINIVNLKLLVFNKAMHALTYHAQALLDGLFKVSTNSHYLAHRFHWWAEFLVNTAEFREVPTRNFTNHIIESRFEEGAGGLCYRVFQFKQAITHTQLSSNKSQRIASSFRCQSWRTAQTSVHLNHAIVFAQGVKSILHVTLAHDTDVANNLDWQCTQLMILAIGQCLRGSDNNTFARMDTQRVEVFHVTNCDTVVVTVAHHLIFNLFPSLQALFNEHLWWEWECLFSQFVQFFFIVAEATTQASQSIGSTKDNGIS